MSRFVERDRGRPKPLNFLAYWIPIYWRIEPDWIDSMPLNMRENRISKTWKLRDLTWPTDGNYERTVNYAMIGTKSDFSGPHHEQYVYPHKGVQISPGDSIRGWLDTGLRPVGAAVVPDDEIRYARMGISYGLRTTGTWHYPTPILQYYDFHVANPLHLTHVEYIFRGTLTPALPQPDSSKIIKRPKTPQKKWHWTNEPKMVATLRPLIVEGLLEALHPIVTHWRKKLDPLEEWANLKPLVGKTDTYQDRVHKQGNLERYVERNLPIVRGNYRQALLELLTLTRELDHAFNLADTMEKLEKAAAAYLQGSFGADWFVRGYFNPAFNHFEVEKMKAMEADAALDRRLKRHGLPYTLFGETNLAPLFDSRPELNRLRQRTS